MGAGGQGGSPLHACHHAPGSAGGDPALPLGARGPLRPPRKKQEMAGFHATGKMIAMLSSFGVLSGREESCGTPGAPY